MLESARERREAFGADEVVAHVQVLQPPERDLAKPETALVREPVLPHIERLERRVHLQHLRYGRRALVADLVPSELEHPQPVVQRQCVGERARARDADRVLREVQRRESWLDALAEDLVDLV